MTIGMTTAKAATKLPRRTAAGKKLTTVVNKPFAEILKTWGHRHGSSEEYALAVKGDCLSPRIPDGYHVTLDPALPRPGELGVFWFTGVEMPLVKIVQSKIFGYPLHPESELAVMVNVTQLNPRKNFTVTINEKVRCIASVRDVYDAKFELVETRPDFSAELGLAPMKMGGTA